MKKRNSTKKIIIAASATVLLLTGIVGYNTAQTANRVVRFARRFLGTDEVGNNLSFDNDRFLALMQEIGWVQGWAWCMSFARMVWLHIYRGDRDVLNQILTHHVDSTYYNAINNPLVVVSRKPTVGALVIWRGKHAGIVEKVVSDSEFITIEGNTNDSGGTEGNTIARKKRTVDSALGKAYFVQLKKYAD